MLNKRSLAVPLLLPLTESRGQGGLHGAALAHEDGQLRVGLLQFGVLFVDEVTEKKKKEEKKEEKEEKKKKKRKRRKRIRKGKEEAGGGGRGRKLQTFD